VMRIDLASGDRTVVSRSASPALGAGVDIGAAFGQNTANFTFGPNLTLSFFITPLIWNAFVITGVGVFFVLLYGGFLYIMGAGQGDNKKIDQAKQAFTWGLIGLIVVFSSFWLIQIVKIFTGLNIISGGST